MDMPAGLEQLVDHYKCKCQKPVAVRPPHWVAALDGNGSDHTALLTIRPVTDSTRAIDRAELFEVCADDFADEQATCQAFVLVMAWGSGTRANRSLRYTRWALADPAYAHRVLATAASNLRAVAYLDESLDRVYDAWRLRGVGQAFFTKWFAFAGRVEGRPWQPLILDSRVYKTLNCTLGVTTSDLAGSRTRSRRYRAYVQAVHDWAEELSRRGHTVDADRLEWILFAHKGEALPVT